MNRKKEAAARHNRPAPYPKQPGQGKVDPERPAWSMPDWMVPYSKHFTNTGRPILGPETIEELFNGRTDPVINLPLSTIEAMVIAQVYLLANLHDEGLLWTPRDLAGREDGRNLDGSFATGKSAEAKRLDEKELEMLRRTIMAPQMTSNSENEEFLEFFDDRGIMDDTYNRLLHKGLLRSSFDAATETGSFTITPRGLIAASFKW